VGLCPFLGAGESRPFVEVAPVASVLFPQVRALSQLAVDANRLPQLLVIRPQPFAQEGPALDEGGIPGGRGQARSAFSRASGP
jgi:hypothetical protein